MTACRKTEVLCFCFFSLEIDYMHNVHVLKSMLFTVNAMWLGGHNSFWMPRKLFRFLGSATVTDGYYALRQFSIKMYEQCHK
jgi:hypothetical protein